jgi:Flp pilus assembly protein CpaB
MENRTAAIQMSVAFTDSDVRDCMPHLKGAMACVALEDIEEIFRSYVRESGCEIMSQLLRSAGWDINGKSFKEMGGW